MDKKFLNKIKPIEKPKEIIKQEKLPEMQMPMLEEKLPEIKMPMPEIKLPEMKMPMPEIKLPEIKLPEEVQVLPEIVKPIEQLPEVKLEYNCEDIQKIVAPKMDELFIKMEPIEAIPEFKEPCKGMVKMKSNCGCGCGCFGSKPLKVHEPMMPQMMPHGVNPLYDPCFLNIYNAYPYMNPNR